MLAHMEERYKIFLITIGLNMASFKPLSFCSGSRWDNSIVQEDVSLCVLFVDYMVLVDQINEWVNAKLEWWKQEVESQSFELSWCKTEWMECNLA